MIKNILLIATFFLVATSHAAVEITPAEVPNNLQIYNEGGNAYVDMTAYACSDGRYQIPASHLKYEAIFSLILAAQISGTSIRLRFDGCNANNQGIVVGVYLK